MHASSKKSCSAARLMFYLPPFKTRAQTGSSLACTTTEWTLVEMYDSRKNLSSSIMTFTMSTCKRKCVDKNPHFYPDISQIKISLSAECAYACVCICVCVTAKFCSSDAVKWKNSAYAHPLPLLFLFSALLMWRYCSIAPDRLSSFSASAQR